MFVKQTLLAVTLLLAPTAAQAQVSPPLVNPKTIFVGQTVHFTPRNQDGAAIASSQCTIMSLADSVATATKDATGTNVKGNAIGLLQSIYWSCTDGVTVVKSALFTVNVTLPPYAVTAIGDTMP